MLFGGGFIAVGGKYFQMWQSSMWNGPQSALRYFLIASVGLVLAQLPPDEEPDRSAGQLGTLTLRTVYCTAPGRPARAPRGENVDQEVTV